MIKKNNHGIFIVVSGPSGVGKGTVCQKLIKKLNAWYSISATTREIRDGEQDGVNYYFLTKEEFEKKISEGNFLEYALYNGNYYGTPKEKILEKINSGVDVFSEIEVQGAKNIKKMFPDALLIYILPPSMEELRRRLEGRGTNSKDDIDNRIAIAYKEFEEINNYDYIVANNDIDETVEVIKEIIASEKHSAKRVELDF